jgi:hypothetical protein
MSDVTQLLDVMQKGEPKSAEELIDPLLALDEALSRLASVDPPRPRGGQALFFCWADPSAGSPRTRGLSGHGRTAMGLRPRLAVRRNARPERTVSYELVAWLLSWLDFAWPQRARRSEGIPARISHRRLKGRWPLDAGQCRRVSMAYHTSHLLTNNRHESLAIPQRPKSRFTH